MALVNFSTIKALRASKDREEVFKEVLLLVLARATRVDSNVESIEVSHVQKALKEIAGAEFSEGDILTAASSEIYESQSLERTLTNATRQLDQEDRAKILYCLSDLIRADGVIRSNELDFFDQAAIALKATPSEIAGLRVTAN
ncbi:MAG: hypothetical protein CMQ41_13990 [Gammaproteobacteria bacterium]|nr:hypothetical protein [Gammaproteobacteria bacterium]|tara:strand:+ start:5823 stop:6251 length:429 start_codon:yes stop_codon:yes gene_type:complete